MSEQITKETDELIKKFIKSNTLSDPTDEQIELHDKLKSVGGYSHDPEYLPLLNTNLAWGFQACDKTYVIDNDDKMSNKVFTVLLSIPTLSPDTVHDFNEHTMLENMRTFLGKWLLKKKEEDVSDNEMKGILEQYISFFNVISIPYVLKETFVEEIEKTKILWRPISPEYDVKECPFCKTKVRVYEDTTTHVCGECGNLFA